MTKNVRSKQPDPTGLLAAVAVELERRKGTLRKVAKGSGVSYDSVLSIKANEFDPGFRKVQKLAEFLGIECKVKPARRPAAPVDATPVGG